MLMIWPWGQMIIPLFGRMAARKIIFLEGLKLQALVCIFLLALEEACGGPSGGTAEEYGDARLERCRASHTGPRALSDRFSVLSFV